IEATDEELTGTNEKINVWKSEIQTIKEDISNKQAEIVKLKTETEQIQIKNKENQIMIDKFIKTLGEQLSTNTTQQEHIQKTIEDVSRAGMAGSFKKRKDELKWIQLAWAVFTILSIAGLLLISSLIVCISDFQTLIFSFVPVSSSSVASIDSTKSFIFFSFSIDKACLVCNSVIKVEESDLILSIPDIINSISAFIDFIWFKSFVNSDNCSLALLISDSNLKGLLFRER
ncbi:MAG TPA: hypothetical protein VHO50_14400, partial [Bacteroidales bacterium]|nr:hypothetical protein [Bacteroidales bacterium]